MGATTSQCRVERSQCSSNTCKGAEALFGGDGSLECIGVEGTDDLDGDVKNSQALINHKLLKAAREGSVKKIEKFLGQGAYIETRRPFVMTPESTNSPSCSLQTRGVGLTPLMYAAQGGYAQACEVLISRGACLIVEDEDGLRPLHFAASSGSEETCRVLLQYGAEPFLEDDDALTPFDHLPSNVVFSQAEKKHWHEVLWMDKLDKADSQGTTGSDPDAAMNEEERSAKMRR
mmetsp:Transcript_103895/g.333014  ORF Transcript_103895/g.333014 Transcript_103895/m.333014 type:complete len:232 (+) Transcript_103895:76-771(+)